MVAGSTDPHYASETQSDASELHPVQVLGEYASVESVNCLEHDRVTFGEPAAERYLAAIQGPAG